MSFINLYDSCSHDLSRINKFFEQGQFKDIIEYIPVPDSIFDLIICIESHLQQDNFSSAENLFNSWKDRILDLYSDCCLRYLSSLIIFRRKSFSLAKKMLTDLLSIIPPQDPLFLNFRSTFSLALVLRELQDLDSSLSLFQALSNNIQNTQSAPQVFLAMSFQQIGNTYFKLGNLEKAIDFFHKSLSLFQQLDNTLSIAGLHNNIGIIYHYKGFIHTAISHQRLGLEIIQSQQSFNKRFLAMILNNLGNLFHLQGNYSNALDYHNKALTLRLQLGNPSLIAMSYNNLGSIFLDMGLYQDALDYQNKSLDLRLLSPDILELAPTLVDKARILFEMNSPLIESKIIEYFEKITANSSHASIKGYKSILQALFSQQIPNYSKAIEFWTNALNYTSLSFHYKVICFEGIIECQLNIWLSTKDEVLKNELLIRLNSFYSMCLENNLSALICKINLLQAKLYMASFDFDNAQSILHDCIINADQWGLPFHKQLALKQLQEIETQLLKIYDKISDQKDYELLQLKDFKSYLKLIHKILRNQ